MKNRPIRFRAWHPSIKEMMPVETIDWDETQYLTEVSAGYTWGEKFDPAKFQQLILMQYTGIKDKNGKEIYEGDIVDLSGKGHLRHIIGWDMQVGRWVFVYPTGEPMRDIGRSRARMVIIGNIYENPELL